MKKEITRFECSNIFEGMVSFRAVIYGMENRITDRSISRVIYDKSREKKLAGHLSYVKAMSYKYGFDVDGVDASEIDEIAVGSSHGGLLTFCTERHIERLTSDRLIDNGYYVLLEGIEDPYNFGYALRSIYASGADGIILPEHNWMSAAGVVCRASAGASEQMNIFTCTPEECVKCFKDTGYQLVSADIKNSVSAYDAQLKKPLLLAIGGEKRGLSKIILENSDLIVRLDYGRDFPSALSAASAASILAFEVLRNNR